MNKIRCHIDFPKEEIVESTVKGFKGWLLNTVDDKSIVKAILSDGSTEVELEKEYRKDVEKAFPNQSVFSFDENINYADFNDDTKVFLKVYFEDSFEYIEINKKVKHTENKKESSIKDKVGLLKNVFTDESSKKYSLEFEPRPLIDPKNKLVLMWSAKSGCTFAIKWFLYQMNLLDEANEMYWWVHSYREKVFYEKDFYKNALFDIPNNPEYKVIKVTRDPYTRVVSSYIHALRFGYENIPLSKYLKREVNENNTFSFREFLNYLKEDCYTRRCNIHHQRQFHPLEENGFVKIDYLVHLEDSMERFNEIEKELGLRSFDLQSVRKQPHHTEKISFDSFCADVKFTKEMIGDGKRVPNYEMFYNQELKSLVKLIYKEDFVHYGY